MGAIWMLHLCNKFFENMRINSHLCCRLADGCGKLTPTSPERGGRYWGCRKHVMR